MLPASAATTSYSSMDLDGQVVAYNYYVALGICGLKGTIKGSDIQNWSFGNGGADVGFIAEATGDGKMSCNSPADLQRMAKAFGFNSSDPGELLCDLGYTQTEANSSGNESSCFKGKVTNGGQNSFSLSDPSTNVKKHLIKTVFGGTTPTATKAMDYDNTLATFLASNGCNAQQITGTNYSGKVVQIKVTKSDGSAATNSYKYDSTSEGGRGYVGAASMPRIQESCDDVARELSTNAGSYFTAYQAALMSDACKQTYGDPSQAAACIAGTKNSGLTYCTKTYPNLAPGTGHTGDPEDQSPIRKACYTGQGNQGAEECIAAYNYSGDQLKACILGAQNSDNTSYCTDTYKPPSPSALIDACLSGQKTPAGNEGLTPKTPHQSQPPADAKTCGDIVTAIGWIVCPVLDAVTGLDDAMWGLVSNLLNVSPLEQSSGAYSVWSAFRNISNVILVIIFLVIIFSQLTGAGVSNYGVKKMLPRLVIAAILINVSFFVMQLAVDLANIIGSSLYGFITHSGAIIDQDKLSWKSVVGTLATGTALGTTAVAGVVAGGAALAFMGPEALLFILPGAVAAFLGFLAAVATLIFRQAAIPILAIVAPLAFAAYILPNTRNWYDRWQKMFVSMLMLYPLASLLFGGVQVAASIIVNHDNIWSEFVALLVLGVPLFSLPFLARQTGPLLSKTYGKMQGWSKQGSKAASKIADPYRKNAYNRALAQPRRAGVFGAALGMAQGFNRRSRNIHQDLKNSEKMLDNQWEEDPTAMHRLMESRTLQNEGKIGELRLDDAYLRSRAGQISTHALEEAKLQLQDTTNRNDTHIEATLPVNLKLRVAASKTELSNAKAETNRAGVEAATLYAQAQRATNPAQRAALEAEAARRTGGDLGLAGDLSVAHTAETVTNQATTIASRLQQQEYARRIRDPANSALVDAAAGIGGTQARSTVLASAQSVVTDATLKEIAAEKTLLTTTPAADLITRYRDASLSDEARAAAIGRLMQVGTDDQIHDALDDVAALPPGPARIALQQQINSDIGSRKPISLGAADMTALSNGTYSGMFISKSEGRLNRGKIAATNLAGATAEELTKIQSVISSMPVKGPEVLKLKADIAAYRSNPNITQPSPEIAGLMDSIAAAI